MALMLVLKEKDVFFLGDRRVEVTRLDSHRSIVVSAEGKEFMVGSDTWTQIYPDVKLQAGVSTTGGSNSAHKVRLRIDATRSVKVIRESLIAKEVCGTCGGSGVLEAPGLCFYCNGHGCARCNNTGRTIVKFKCPDCKEESPCC